MKLQFLPVICLLFGFAAGPATGAPTLPDTSEKSAVANASLHQRLSDTVATFVRQQTSSLPGKVAFHVDEIDSRLTLSACTHLEAFLPERSQMIGRVSVGVRCNAAPHWKIYVPVQVSTTFDVLVAVGRLPMGHVLQERDLSSMPMEVTQMTGLTDPKLAIGKSLRYGIAAGQVLREQMLRPVYSVTQGQIVQLVAKGSGFSINSEGAALNNASEGQSVQVRVKSSRVVGGIAATNGVVEVGL
ncbi:MAG: flagellar basal body P-ring formation chaperone FlgA [Gallionella sp.]